MVGLVDCDQGRVMLGKLLRLLRDVGFDRFDLGLPHHLRPIRREDYSFGGLPSSVEEDGSDQYQVYMNGSASTSQAYWFLQALYDVGLRHEANVIWHQLARSFERGGLCGPLNSGLDWRTWDGEAAGYEGLLVDQFHVLLATLTGYLGLELTLDGFRYGPESGCAFIEKYYLAPLDIVPEAAHQR